MQPLTPVDWIGYVCLLYCVLSAIGLAVWIWIGRR